MEDIAINQSGFLAELATWFEGLKAEFTLNFITKNRWRLLLNGLENTLLITLVACLIGIAIGIVIATIRSTWDKTGHTIQRRGPRALLRLVDGICRLYITVIRGTPVVIQLMIMYYIIFIYTSNGVMVAILAIGLNSGAYVSEIFRGGIMSID